MGGGLWILLLPVLGWYGWWWWTIGRKDEKALRDIRKMSHVPDEFGGKQ